MVAVVTLIAGVITGYLAQRSRLCFVGGLRDFLLIRDTELLKGAIAFFLAAWLAFPLVSLLGGTVWTVSEPAAPTADLVTPVGPSEAPLPPEEPQISSPAPFRPWLPAVVAVVAGFGLGFASVLANGCPLRQHVLAGQGLGDAWAYLAGFYAGALAYHQLVQPVLSSLFN